MAEQDPAIIAPTSQVTREENKNLSSSPEKPQFTTSTPLEHSYVVWLQLSQTNQSTGQKKYADNFQSGMKSIGKFSTIEEFWEIYQFLKRPSQLPQPTILCIFVEGVKPMWEDEANKVGGRWRLRVNKGYANKIWEDLILALIGEQFDCDNEISGIYLNIQPTFDNFQIWNRNGKDTAMIEKIRSDLVRILSLTSEIKMDYGEFFPDNKGEGGAGGGQEHRPKKDFGAGQGEKRQRKQSDSQQQQPSAAQYKPKKQGGDRR